MSNLTLTRTQIYIQKSVLSKAKLKAIRSKTTVSKIIRLALEKFLEEEKNVKKPKINIFKLKDREIKKYSAEVDRIYDY